MSHFKEYLTYDDVLMVPQYSEIKSRSECDTRVYLDKTLYLDIPIIASPMDTISGPEMAYGMDKLGGMAVIHRYNTIDEQVALVKSTLTRGKKNIGAAIGATGDYLERSQELVKAGANLLCVDVAHGHHILVEDALSDLRRQHGSHIHIMAGNVATARGFADLEAWGADSIRIGVGNGSICSTRLQTGHGVPSFTLLQECANITKGAKLIADGGLKTSGDIVKALAAGADAVMLGSMLSGTDACPGDFIERDGKLYKTYRGMASSEAQNDWRGKSSAPEGISATVPYKGKLEDVVANIVGGIRSGMSYSNAKFLSELQAKAQFIRQTGAGQVESSTHILNRV
jgi:IMP dehydrogenase